MALASAPSTAPTRTLLTATQVNLATNLGRFNGATFTPPLNAGILSVLQDIITSNIPQFTTSVAEFTSHHDINHFRACMMAGDAIIAQMNTIYDNLTDVAHRWPWDTQVQPSLCAFTSALNELRNANKGFWREMGDNIGNLWSAVQRNKIATLGVLVGLGATYAGFRTQGFTANGEPNKSRSHRSTQVQNRNANPAEIFANFKAWVSIESPDKEKFDGLYNAIRKSERSWVRSTATAWFESSANHFSKKATYKIDGRPVVCTVFMSLGADKEGIRDTTRYIVIQGKATRDDNWEVLFNDKERFQRGGDDDSSVLYSKDSGAYAPISLRDMETKINDWRDAFGK